MIEKQMGPWFFILFSPVTWETTWSSQEQEDTVAAVSWREVGEKLQLTMHSVDRRLRALSFAHDYT